MTRAWALLLVVCTGVLVAAECALLGLGTGLLTSGYNSPRLDEALLWLGFLPGSVLLDLWLVVALVALVVPIARCLTGGALQLYTAAAVGALLPPLALTVVRYDLHSRFGEMFSLVLAGEFSTLGASDAASQLIDVTPYLAGGLGTCLVGSLALWALAGRFSRAMRGKLPQVGRPPSQRRLCTATLALGVAGALLLGLSSTHEGLRYGFARKASGRTLGTLVDTLSDLDRDGFGSLYHPTDPFPLDASRYPYALDLPGNGVDENGIGGDHPLPDVGASRDWEPVPDGPRPHVLVVYLESFREDLLGQRIGGRPVTPFLDRLAAEGGASPHAYTHAPWTLESRAQLFGGRIVNRRGESTLIDDFQARGYTVAHFSGQDDSYGNSVEILGADRADAFYDARQDVELRTSRSAAPVSLQVSWKTLLQRTSAWLDGYDGDTPLFLYVNVVDTHFPYAHAELDPILDVAPVGRGGIRADSARRVFETYANTAANVDRAVEALVQRFRAAIGGADHAILVTADHGQAFYEHGALGHGQHLGEEETRVPFVLWGLGGDWPEPIAPSDVRGLLRRNLTAERDGATPPRPRFAEDPQRRILQYASKLEAPRYVAYRGTRETLHYDFARDLWEVHHPDGRRTPTSSPRETLKRAMIWRWEAVQRIAAAPLEALQPTHVAALR